MKKYLFLLLMLMSLNRALAIETTAVPEVNVEFTDDAVIIFAIGDGEVVLYVNDEAVENPYTIARPEPGEDAITYYVYATAQEPGKEMSESDIMPVVVEPKEGEIPSDPHKTGVWLVTIDMDGRELWKELMYYDGDFTGFLRLSSGIYGDSNMRPLVQLYICYDGVRYGATSPNRHISSDNMFENLLIKSSNYFVVENGYKHIIGVFITYNGNLYLYAIKLPLDNEEDPNGYILGDADRDGKVTITDVTTMIDYLLSENSTEGEIPQISKVNADCDGNGQVTIADLTLLIDYLLKDNWY